MILKLREDDVSEMESYEENTQCNNLLSQILNVPFILYHN